MGRNFLDKGKILPAKFTVTAHTGCLGTPMNSISSIEKGIEAGADIVEFDLRFLSNGTPVISHMPNEKENAVTFADAVDAVRKHDNVLMNIDLKETSNLLKLVTILKEKGMYERCFFTGVFTKMLADVKRADTGIPFYLNFTNNPFLGFSKTVRKRYLCAAKVYGVVGINLCKLYATRRFVKEIRDSGFLVSIWTVSKERDMEKYLELLPDNITTREPKALVNKIHDLGYEREK